MVTEKLESFSRKDLLEDPVRQFALWYEQALAQEPFDVSAMTNYTTDIDNAQKVLVVTLPEAGWSGKQAVEGLKSPLVGGWRVAPRAEGGTIVTIQLKKDAKVVGTERLKAAGQTPARIVIDIGIDAAPQG